VISNIISWSAPQGADVITVITSVPTSACVGVFVNPGGDGGGDDDFDSSHVDLCKALGALYLGAPRGYLTL
jgi:hypothetical protein